MKRLSIRFFAIATLLLCAWTASAATYCGEVITSTNGKHTAAITCSSLGDNHYQFIFESADAFTSYNAAGSNFYMNVNGVGGYHVSEHLTQEGNKLAVEIESTVAPNIYAGAFFVVYADGEAQFNIPTDADFSQKCAGGDERKASDLILTAPENTTLALETGDTYTITYTTSSKGAVTYESSNAAVATVSNTGVISALATGSTTITVSQEADDTYRAGKKTFTLLVSAKAVASNKGFGTYQGTVDLYDWNGEFAGTNVCGKANLYIATLGDDLIFKASVVDGTFENATNYFCQLRTWNTELTAKVEHWAEICSEDLVTRSMDVKKDALSGYGEVIPMTSYMVVTGCGARTMQTLMYKRDYINNPTADTEAPVLGQATVTKQEGSTLITFPAVTTEEVFYLLKDEEHNVQMLSLTPSFTITNDGSGIAYQFSCYVIDFNGNMSAAQVVPVTMDFDATANLALNKPCKAGFEAANSEASKANDGKDDTRWASGGGNNPDDAWWYVDLGTIYNLSKLEIVWEGAYATDYVIMGSDTYIDPADETAWAAATNLVTATEAPAVKPTATAYTVKGHARYLRFKANTLLDNGWGASFWEFRAYALGVYDPNATEDTEAPKMVSATLKSCTYNEAVITVEATDNVGVVLYHVEDAANGFSTTAAPVEGAITVTGLQAETTYTFNISAQDAAGNVSTPLVMSAFKTAIDPTIPHVAAPQPTDNAANVLAFYSDAYTPVVNLWGKKQWNGGTLAENNVDGDNYLWYSGVVWWGWEFNVNEGYNKAGVSTGVDCSAMDYLHIDVWGTEDGTIKVIPIWGGTDLTADPTIGLKTNDQYGAVIEVKANEWTSYNISLKDDFAPEDKKHDFSTIFQFKFDGLTTSFVAIDNVYFYKAGTTTTVDVTTTPAYSQKTIENGQLVIIRDGIRYNAQGVQIR